MSRSFSAGGSGNSLKFGVALALLLNLPFLITIFLFWEKPDITTLLILLLPVGVSGFIVYISYASRSMEYVLEEKDLFVKFPASPIRFRYDRIRGAARVETTLVFRLFGASLPGAHWGKFTTSNLGSVQVYSTRYRGEFVLLELMDGTRVLLSPREPDAFVEALKEKTTLVAPTLTLLEPPPLDRRLAFSQVAVVTLAWVALVAYIAYIYPGLPDVIPVHFGLNGVPNRYGSKNELFILAGVATIFPVMNAVFALKFGKYNRGLTVFLGFVFTLAIVLFAVVVNQMANVVVI